ncbi:MULTISPECIES: hypothetical protein [Roseinatronobacter]|uniref:Lipoprotein n=1 Tax=Roseinatronobacter domitianus TaxID=2940293 RepID=A0ABT0LXJ2_9RHOB|nr:MULTISPECIES: hypothetical protein [Roseibaca]MCL1627326.1 hypothetical protein [Roseibaca domitiana]
MQKPAVAALALVLALGACGSGSLSRLNPMTWFGSDEVETIAPAGGWGGPADRRALVPAVRDMEVLRTPEGAIIRASGVTETQGWWDVQLRPVNDERPLDGALIYEFVLAAPRTQTGTGPEPSRTVNAAVKVTNFQLAGVRRIVVRGAQNALSVRR